MKYKTRIYSGIFIVLAVMNIAYYRQDLLQYFMTLSLYKNDIVISLTTTPHRIKNSGPTIETILNQSCFSKPGSKVKIYLSIPYKFARDNLEYEIPEWMLNNPKITIVRTADYGPATKLLGVLAAVNLKPETIIVTLDDDVLYPSNLVTQLAYAAAKNPNAAFGVVGSYIDPTEPQLGLRKTNVNDASVDILHGYAGIAYRRSFFDHNIFDVTNAPRECINSDDLYIAFYLAAHGIPRKVLNNQYISPCDIGWNVPIGTSHDALHQLSPKPIEKHRICLRYLQKLDTKVDFGPKIQ